jgi:hypothetical protein
MNLSVWNSKGAESVAHCRALEQHVIDLEMILSTTVTKKKKGICNSLEAKVQKILKNLLLKFESLKELFPDYVLCFVYLLYFY